MAIKKLVLILNLFLFIVGQGSTSYAGVAACNWDRVSINTENIYQSCQSYGQVIEQSKSQIKLVEQRKSPYPDLDKNISLFEKDYQNCIVPDVEFMSNLRTELIREQMKLIFNQELTYISRWTPDSPFYENIWSQFRKRWRQREILAPEILSYDRRPELKRDQCALHIKLGLECAGLPKIDSISLQQNRFKSLALKKASARIIPVGITFDLIEAVLLLKVNELVSPAEKNLIYSYFPELAVAPSLNRVVEHILNIRHLGPLEISRALWNSQASPKSIVDETMAKVFVQMPLRVDEASDLNQRIFAAQSDVFRKFDAFLRRGQMDQNWLLEQDFLLAPRMKQSLNLRQLDKAAALQTLICHNDYVADQEKSKRDRWMLIGGAGALVSGVGMLFDFGAIVGAVMTSTTFSLVASLSWAQISAAASALDIQNDLLLQHRADHLQFAASEREFMATIPSAIANLSLFAPIAILHKISQAQRLAEASHDVLRVAELSRYRKAVILVATVGGVALTAQSVRDASAAIDDLGAELDVPGAAK
jgi:hypothetical protein